MNSSERRLQSIVLTVSFVFCIRFDVAKSNKQFIYIYKFGKRKKRAHTHYIILLGFELIVKIVDMPSFRKHVMHTFAG